MRQLPSLIDELAQRWSIEVLEPFEPGGQCAWVAPARLPSGVGVVVKVSWPHPESEHEAVGLALWEGDGAVRLIDATTVQDSPALLLEQCRPGTTLAQTAAPADRDLVVAGLLTRLWREPPRGHPFRPLEQMCREWADGAERDLASVPAADAVLIRAGLALFRELAAEARGSVVLLTDLHAGNVLAAEREPWLAIDPKPYVGDPCYDVLQHLLNESRLLHDPDWMVRRMADLAGLDAARLRLWTFARCAVMAVGDPGFASVMERLAP